MYLLNAFAIATGRRSSRPLRPCYDRPVAEFGEPDKTSHISKTVLSIVKFGGVSTDRACLRRVAAPIMSTWAVPTPWQRVVRRNHRRRVRASSRRE